MRSEEEEEEEERDIQMLRYSGWTSTEFLSHSDSVSVPSTFIHPS